MSDCVDSGITEGAVGGRSPRDEQVTYTLDELIDPFCETCFYESDKGSKLAAKGFCDDCNMFLCKPCDDFHGRFLGTKNHTVSHGSKMPKSMADKPVRYPRCLDHPGNLKDQFCTNHGEMVCSQCSARNHTPCNVRALCDVSKFLKSSDLADLQKSVTEIQRNVISVKTKAHSLTTAVENQRKEKLKEAKDLRDKAVAHVEKLYGGTVANINKVCERSISELANHETSLDAKERSLKMAISDITKSRKLSLDENMFIHVQTVVEATRKCSKEINVINTEVTGKQLDMLMNAEVSNLLSTTEGLGQIKITPSKPDRLGLPTVMCPRLGVTENRKDEVDWSKVKAVKKEPLVSKLSGDGDKIGFGKMDATSDGTLLIPDFHNKKIKLFSLENELISSFSLPENPKQVVVLNDNTAAVSVKDRIYMLDISNTSVLSIKDTVSVTGDVYSMTSCNGTLIVSLLTEPVSVRRIDPSGKQLWSVSVDSKGQALFKYPAWMVTISNVNNIFIVLNDWSTGHYTYIDSRNGNVIKICNGGCFHCITTGGKEALLSCRSSGGVDVYSTEMKYKRTLVKPSELSGKPHSVLYNPAVGEIIVAHRGTYVIDRFRLS